VTESAPQTHCLIIVCCSVGGANVFDARMRSNEKPSRSVGTRTVSIGIDVPLSFFSLTSLSHPVTNLSYAVKVAPPDEWSRRRSGQAEGTKSSCRIAATIKCLVCLRSVKQKAELWHRADEMRLTSKESDNRSTSCSYFTELSVCTTDGDTRTVLENIE
jgi:hypothetical protein